MRVTKLVVDDRAGVKFELHVQSGDGPTHQTMQDMQEAGTLQAALNDAGEALRGHLTGRTVTVLVKG